MKISHHLQGLAPEINEGLGEEEERIAQPPTLPPQTRKSFRNYNNNYIQPS